MNTRESTNFKKLNEIQQFLMSYYPIWEKEVLNYYPDSYQNFPKTWVRQVMGLSDKEQWQIDSKQSFIPLRETELFSLFQELENQTKAFSSFKLSLFQLAKNEKMGIKEKKQHEIQQIIGALKEKKERRNFPKSFIDIGGGKGHLARIINRNLGLNGSCVEMNPTLIKSGKKLLSQSDQIQFHPFHFSETCLESNTQKLKSIRGESPSLCIGLHTCGELANSLITASHKESIEEILSFGCCYLKLSPGKNIGISKAAQSKPLPLSKYALTLATRAHTGTSWQDFQMKKRVKFYRYGIHLYLYYKLNIKEFMNVGDGKKKDYAHTFGHYVLEKLNHLEIEAFENIDEINKWFNSSSIQKKINEMFAMNIIRWQFGRAIELWILLDRACYLEENGYLVNLETFFDEKISPRNIGIYAKKISNNC